jgi:hypothetical protein
VAFIELLLRELFSIAKLSGDGKAGQTRWHDNPAKTPDCQFHRPAVDKHSGRKFMTLLPTPS